MMESLDPLKLRDHARAIWKKAVDAAQPEKLIAQAFADPGLPLLQAVQTAPRILVIGAGKAGAAMAVGLEASLADSVERMEGIVNVPAGWLPPLKAIRLHVARPTGSNQPTPEGVAGASGILDLVASAGPEDVAICLLSGGGSALLPAPVEDITLKDKQLLTRELHACGATINEMNCVRKHLSRVKGGNLARSFHGKAMFSLIISDVVGDPIDAIASGPTAPDPTTFADALGILRKYQLLKRAPLAVIRYLKKGMNGHSPETLKELPPNIHNFVIGSNSLSLCAAQAEAEKRGFRVLSLGSFIEGETREAAGVFAGIARAIREIGQPFPPPVCVLSGGETTVTLDSNHGKGGRNQEFVLAAALKMGEAGMRGVAILSGGTDGEDGPTDAAGACADEEVCTQARALGLNGSSFLVRNDAYHFFERAGGLLKTGLTHTNVMDVRVILIA